jgi:hypothetical protein
MDSGPSVLVAIRREEQLVAAVAFSLAAVVGVVAVIELAMQSKCTSNSTQYTVHSTQYTASHWHAILLPQGGPL